MDKPNLRLIEGGAGNSAEAEKVSSTRKSLEDTLAAGRRLRETLGLIGAETEGKLFPNFNREAMIGELEKITEVSDNISDKDLAEKFLNLVVNPQLKFFEGKEIAAGLLKVEPKKAASDIANAA
jgi:hypothetical protein